MSAPVEEVPELSYRYTFQETDRRRFLKAMMAVWLLRNPSLRWVLAIEFTALTLIGAASGSWWVLAVLPVVFVFIAVVVLIKGIRGNAHLRAGNQVSAGYSSTALRVVDPTGQIIFPYSAFTAVWEISGFVGLKFTRGRVMLLPRQVCPPDVRAAVDQRIRAASARPSR